jgi:hypothetical protein
LAQQGQRSGLQARLLGWPQLEWHRALWLLLGRRTQQLQKAQQQGMARRPCPELHCTFLQELGRSQ